MSEKKNNTNPPSSNDSHYYEEELKGGDYVSHLSHNVNSTSYEESKIFTPEEDISHHKNRKDRVIDRYMETYQSTLSEDTDKHTTTSAEDTPFDIYNETIHPDVKSTQNDFLIPNLDALGGEYQAFSSGLDAKFEKMGVLGQGLLFIKHLITAVLYLCLLAAVIVGAILLLGIQIILFFFGGIFSGAAGGINFVLERIATFIVLTIVFMGGWHLFWQMNPELSLRVDEWGRKINMYTQRYLGGFRLPDINFFDDAVEDTVKSGINAIGIDTNSVPRLPSLPATSYGNSTFLPDSLDLPNGLQITDATSLLDILPKDTIENTVPDALKPLVSAAGDPQAVAAISSILSQGVNERNIEKTLPLLKQTLLSTQSNEMRSAVLDTLNNIRSPVSRQIIRDYEKLIGQ